MTPQHAGVLLAAGRSRRMGRAKQLLPVPTPDGRGTQAMVCAAFDILAHACADRIVVVTGHEASAVRAALHPRAFVEAASNADADMLESVRAGLRAALGRFGDADALWLHLVDVPFVSPHTLARLSLAYAQRPPGTMSVMPVHAGHGGHPVVMTPVAAREIIGWDAGGGLREFWRAHAGACVRLDVNDPGVTRDLDSPDEYNDAVRGS